MKLIASIIAFLACTAAVVAAAGAIGNVLPEPHRSFVPMLAGDDFTRDEFVRRHAVTETPAPCIAFLGDSRVAFNITGATIDAGMPGCRSQNYGFPALSLKQIAGIASKLTVTRSIVVSITEPMVSGPRDESWLYVNIGERAEKALRIALLQIDWVRRLYLGHHRLNQYVRKSLGMSTALDSGWSWSTEQKRWLYAGLEARAMVKLPTYEQEAKAIAVSYFRNNRPAHAEELAQLLRTLSAKTERLIVLLPPSELRFQELADVQSAGQQTQTWQLIRDVANSVGAVLIDCSRAAECGVEPAGFGDPVHLNDAGVAMYSRFLAGRLSSYMAR
jgi:hypothetical protein